MTRLASVLFGAALLAAVSATSQAARLIIPPSQELTRNHNITMVAVAKQRLGEYRVTFERVAPLYGKSEPEVSMRMDEATYNDIEIGETYIVAYSKVTHNEQRREEKVIDPRGPRLLKVRGYGSRALFENTAQVRFLFETARAEEPPGDRQLLAALVSQMGSDDPRTRALVIVELYLRPELARIASKADVKQFRAVIDDKNTETELRAFLLETALEFPENTTRRWLAKTYRGIVDNTSAQFDLNSRQPALVETAVNGLRARGDQRDFGRLSGFIASNAPKVAEASVKTMDGWDRQATFDMVQATISDDSVPAPTRSVLEAYLFERLKSPDDLDFGGFSTES
jgi:hypothetical protein